LSESEAAVEVRDGLPVRFFAIAYVFSWVFWTGALAGQRGWVSSPALVKLNTPLLMAGAFGPFVAAMILSARESKGGAWRLLKRALRWRIPPVVLMVSVVLVPVMAALAVEIRAAQGGPALVCNVAPKTLIVLVILLFFLGGSFQEEFGWAYAIDRMQPRWGFVKGSLLLGVIWACWHLPLFFMPGQSQSHMPFWTFLILTAALRVMFVWAYNSSAQSVLVTLLFHTSLNLTLNLFTVLDMSPGSEQVTWMYFTGMLAVVAGVMVVGKMRKSRD